MNAIPPPHSGPRYGRTYDDDDLAAAIKAAHSWRGVLRRLGLQATSSSAIRSVRQHAERLGLDASHFTGQRRWTHAQLSEAVAMSTSWVEVAVALGLSAGTSSTLLKGHAVRLGLDFSHFSHRSATSRAEVPVMNPDNSNLPRAGGLLAATWFTLCGYEVSWPLEPCRYDLVVCDAQRALRVQVKTTRHHPHGGWVAGLLSGGRQRGTYDPDDIDYFFVINGDLVTT
jgi:hypothetical protein